MIIRCTKCSTEFALDPSQVGPEGVTLRCSVCSHMFHAEPDPDVLPTPWKVNTADRHSLVLADLRRVLEQVEEGRLRPEDQLSHTGQTWIRLGEMPEFSSLFVGVEGLPRVFKALETAAAPDPHRHHGEEDDVRREETVRVRVQNVLGARTSSRDDDPLPAPPDFGAPVPEPQPMRHLTQEFVSRGASSSDLGLPAPPEFATRGTGGHRTLGHNPLLGGPVAAESGALPAPPDFDTAPAARPARPAPADTRPKKPPPASMLEAVTKVVAGSDDDAPDTEASRSRSQPILVADLARAAAAHAEKTVQAVDSQRAREKAARGEAETSTGGRAATAAAVSAAMAIARESTREPTVRVGSDRDAMRSTERFPADRPVDRPGTDRPPTDRSAALSRPAPDGPRDTGRIDTRGSDTGRIDPRSLETVRADTGRIDTRGLDTTRDSGRIDAAPHPEPSTALPTEGDPAVVPRPPEVVIVKVAEPARSSGLLVGLLGIAAAAAIVFGVPSIRERVFNLGQPAPVTKAEPTKAPPAAMPTEEFNQARAATHSLGLKATNKAQTALQRIIDDPKRPPAAVAQAKQLLAGLLLERALACQIAVALEPSAMSGEAQDRVTEDPAVARELIAGLAAADPPPPADAQARLTALQAMVAGESPQIPPGQDDLAAVVRAAPLWRGQIKTPPSGLITALQRLSNPSTLSKSVLALALVRSGDETGARELLLEILGVVPDQPVARTLLDVLDRQGMMNEHGDPEVAPAGDPPPDLPVIPPRPTTTDPTKAAAVPPRPEGIATIIETMISTGCQKVRAGDPEGVKLLLEAIERGAKPRDNFNLSFCLGNGFARQNAHDTAFIWYSRAIELSPTNRDAIAGAARSAELLGRTNVAIEHYKKLRALEPGNTAANAYLGKHERVEDPTPTPPTPTPGGDEQPDPLMPVKRKSP